MGQVTVMVEDFRACLSMSLRPLPLGKVEEDAETGERITHSGFADRESRYRQRYADLAVNPDVRKVFRTRTRIVTAMRRFLDGLGFVEVETPRAATALRRRVGAAVSSPATWRWTACCTCASPTNCT